MDYDERRKLILVAAGQLFSERPYAEVSMADLADAAGVARGLLHHYFRSKHDLYLEVVRDVVQVPVMPVPEGAARLSVDEVWERSVDGWLRLIEANAEMWVTATTVGAGQDAEVQGILDEAKEVVVEQALRALAIDVATAGPELRALGRGYGGMVEEITLEWLQRGRLTKEQVRTILLRTLPLLLREILPQLTSD